MSKTRVLITVTTYPLPSRSYDKLICTAGILPSGEWIRIYPVPLTFFDYRKYQWVELELIEHEPGRDFRPESRRPKQPDLSDLEIVRHIDTAQNWYERKEACLQHVYTNMTALIKDSKAPDNVSLAAFKPSAFRRFIVEDDDREWKEQWLEQLKQVDMFTGGSATSKTRVPIDKIPYKFKYQFEDDEGCSSKMTIEDWEIGALYRNCLAAAKAVSTFADGWRTPRSIWLTYPIDTLEALARVLCVIAHTPSAFAPAPAPAALCALAPSALA